MKNGINLGGLILALGVMLIGILGVTSSVLWYGFGNDLLITDYYKQYTLRQTIFTFKYIILAWVFIISLAIYLLKEFIKEIKPSRR